MEQKSIQWKFFTEAPSSHKTLFIENCSWYCFGNLVKKDRKTYVQIDLGFQKNYKEYSLKEVRDWKWRWVYLSDVIYSIRPETDTPQIGVREVSHE